MSIRHWFRNWISRPECEDVEGLTNMKYRAVAAVSSSQVLNESQSAIRLTIHNASGGRVVETSTYNHHKDRNFFNLYIITRDQDFGKEIEKILTMESLKS